MRKQLSFEDDHDGETIYFLGSSAFASSYNKVTYQKLSLSLSIISKKYVSRYKQKMWYSKPLTYTAEKHHFPILSVLIKCFIIVLNDVSLSLSTIYKGIYLIHNWINSKENFVYKIR